MDPAHQAHKEEVRRKRSQKLSKSPSHAHGHLRQTSQTVNTTKSLPPTPVNQSPASPPQRLPPLISPTSATPLYHSDERQKRRSNDGRRGYAVEPEASTSRRLRTSNVRFVGPVEEEPEDTRTTAMAEPEVEEVAHPAETSTRLSHERTLVGHAFNEKDLEGLPSFTQARPYPRPKIKSPEEEAFRRSMRRRRMRILLVSAVIISLLVIAIILLVRIVRPKIHSATSSIGTASLSNAQSQCLSSFLDDAPGNPTGYDCGSCLPAFQSVPQAFMQSADHAQDADNILAAMQFCGMKAIFDSTSGDGLSSLGWLQDIKTCTWGGVTCDGSGSVSALNLQAPGVPQTLPGDISILTSLSVLNITGDHTIPGGQVNPSLPSSLQSLSLFNTSLQGFSDDSLFQQNGTLAGLTTLIMDGNPGMGSTLPTSLSFLSLQTLIVRSQNLNIDLNPIVTSPTFYNSLTTLDLSSNALTGALPLIYLSHLTTLNLSNNNLTLLPADLTFPPTLLSLSFENNHFLNGTISGALCTDGNLGTCSFVGTVFSTVPNITCGNCHFN